MLKNLGRQLIRTAFVVWSQDSNLQMPSLMRNQVKCVVLGDGGVGKTSLLITFCCGEFPSQYTPSVFDNNNCPVSIAVGEQTYHMALWDLGKPCLTKTDDFCKIMLKNSGKVSRLRPRPNQRRPFRTFPKILPKILVREGFPFRWWGRLPQIEASLLSRY